MLDDELLRKAQELPGVTERTALLRQALETLIHVEASRRLWKTLSAQGLTRSEERGIQTMSEATAGIVVAISPSLPSLFTARPEAQFKVA